MYIFLWTGCFVFIRRDLRCTADYFAIFSDSPSILIFFGKRIFNKIDVNLKLPSDSFRKIINFGDEWIYKNFKLSKQIYSLLLKLLE